MTRNYHGMNTFKESLAKQSQVNGFLRRNLHHFPVSVKNNCYKMMVRPIVEYASSVWAPHTHTNINQLESIQRRAARFCYNIFFRFSSVTRIMSSLNLPTQWRIQDGAFVANPPLPSRNCIQDRDTLIEQSITLTLFMRQCSLPMKL